MPTAAWWTQLEGKCPAAFPALCVCFLCTHLNIDDGDGGLGLVEVPSHPVHGLWDVVQHQIQIHLIFLERRRKKKWRRVEKQTGIKKLIGLHMGGVSEQNTMIVISCMIEEGFYKDNVKHLSHSMNICCKWWLNKQLQLMQLIDNITHTYFKSNRAHQSLWV